MKYKTKSVNRPKMMRKLWKNPEYRAKFMGHSVSEETRKKIGLANSKILKGYKHSEKAKNNMSKAQKLKWKRLKANKDFMEQWSFKQSKSHKGKYTGEQASNWRGGINQNQRTDNRIFAWKEVILQRDNYTCQICNDIGIFLHVDHIKSWSEYPELRFDISNGRAVCRPCHYYITFKRKMPLGSKWAVGIRDLQ